MAKTRNWALKRILAGSTVIAAILAGTWFAFGAILEWREARLTDAYVKQIIDRLDLTTMPNFHQRVDKVRAFINDNSMHKVDEEFRANQGYQASFAAGLLAYANDEAPQRVHMECASRSNIMQVVLRALGYETRGIAIFNSKTNLSSHSFLEIMNPETGRWETQDPAFDIYWRHRASGERVSVADMAEDLDAIEPCGRSRCGWDHVTWEGIRAEKLRRYLDIIGLTQRELDMRYALYTSRADLSRIYTKEGKRGTFCEVQAKRCRRGFYDLRKFSSYAPGLPRADGHPGADIKGFMQ